MYRCARSDLYAYKVPFLCSPVAQKRPQPAVIKALNLEVLSNSCQRNLHANISRDRYIAMSSLYLTCLRQPPLIATTATLHFVVVDNFDSIAIFI